MTTVSDIMQKYCIDESEKKTNEFVILYSNPKIAKFQKQNRIKPMNFEEACKFLGAKKIPLTESRGNFGGVRLTDKNGERFVPYKTFSGGKTIYINW